MPKTKYKPAKYNNSKTTNNIPHVYKDSKKNADPILLFSPEHFYLFNTNALPQLTGYLAENGYPVVQRVLDNEFYSHVSQPETIQNSLNYLKRNLQDLDTDQLEFLKESIVTGKLTEILNIDMKHSKDILSEFLSCEKKIIKLLHKAERLLTRKFLSLSKNRFLLSMARLQCTIDIFTAPFWPSKFGLFDGPTFTYATERSKIVYKAIQDDKNNFLLTYYSDYIIPSIPPNTRIIGISLTHESQIIPAFTLTKQIRSHYPDAHITLGGATVSTLRDTFEKENVLWEFYDSVIVGAGEEPLSRLYVELTSDRCDLNRVPNLAWKNDDGQIMKSSASKTFTMEQIATPIFADPRPKPILTLMTSMGCDWAKCQYCHFPQIFSKDTSYFTRPINDVLRDIRTLTEKHDPSYFHICDTNLSVSRIEKLSDAILKSNLSARFYSFVRPENKFTDINFCKKVRKAGFFALHFGLESGSQKVLNFVQKGTDLKTVRQVVKNFFDTDIMVNVFLMVGTPGENLEDIDKTVDFVKELLPYMRGEVAVSRYYLDKYSYIYYHPEKFGLRLDVDEEADLDTDVNFSNPNGISPEDMPALVEDFYKRIGIPVSYGERYFFEMLDKYCPKGTWQNVTLYSPFIWSKIKKQTHRLFPLKTKKQLSHSS